MDVTCKQRPKSPVYNLVVKKITNPYTAKKMFERRAAAR